MQDKQIVDLYWQRSERAISETADRYGAYCRAVAYNILHSEEDSEECVNDTWLHAWNAIPPQRPARLRIFLAKITRNLALDKFKAQTAGKRGGGEVELILDELSECVSAGGDAEGQFLAQELEETINRFVHTLPKRDCSIFVRRYFFAESIEAIAKKYGLSANNVTVILSRTRQKLKTYLKKEGYM